MFKSPGDSPAAQEIAAELVSIGGRSLSDGMKALLGTDAEGPYVEIIRLTEVKAGPEAKRELARVRESWDKASEDGKAEARKNVIEDLAKNASGDVVQAGLETVRASLTNEELEYRAKREYERSEHLGQPARLLERLSPDVETHEGSSRELPAIMTIAGVLRRVKGFSRRRIKVEGVIPAGVSPGRTEAAVRGQGIDFTLKTEDGITMDILRSLSDQVVAAAAKAKGAE